MIELNFTDKVVVVSGGGTGIGYGIAEAFLDAGAKVVIAGRSNDKLQTAEQQLSNKATSDNFHALSADLSKLDQFESLIEQTKSKFGGFDILVNCASIWSLTPIELFNDELLQSYFDCNLKTIMYGAKISEKHMTNGGVIINLGSFSGLMPMQNASIYASLKSSVGTFTRSCATELADKNIRVNCVIPGVIRTPMTSDHIDAHYKDLTRVIPMKKVGDVQDVANGVLFLCSDFASYITGTSLEITGGKFATQF